LSPQPLPTSSGRQEASLPASVERVQPIIQKVSFYICSDTVAKSALTCSCRPLGCLPLLGFNVSWIFGSKYASLQPIVNLICSAGRWGFERDNPTRTSAIRFPVCLL
jgi:hypothetical protein